MNGRAAVVAMLERVAPRCTLQWRGRRNTRELYGLHAPASSLVQLVPRGRRAIDVGANRGLYAYWMSQAASVVELFEPNPRLARILRRSAQPSWNVHDVALSDRTGDATLLVPQGLDGEASLVARSGIRNLHPFTVRTERLDAYDFADVGFLKIDVEGHEDAVLKGAHGTIHRCRPVVFIELEERHREGAVKAGAHELLKVHGYEWGGFFLNGVLRPIAEFNATAHQRWWAEQPSSPDYVSNFVFLPTSP